LNRCRRNRRDYGFSPTENDFLLKPSTTDTRLKRDDPTAKLTPAGCRARETTPHYAVTETRPCIVLRFALYIRSNIVVLSIVNYFTETILRWTTRIMNRRRTVVKTDGVFEQMALSFNCVFFPPPPPPHASCPWFMR